MSCWCIWQVRKWACCCCLPATACLLLLLFVQMVDTEVGVMLRVILLPA